MCPKFFLKTAGKPNNHQFYSTNFLKFCECLKKTGKIRESLENPGIFLA